MLIVIHVRVRFHSFHSIEFFKDTFEPFQRVGSLLVLLKLNGTRELCFTMVKHMSAVLNRYVWKMLFG
jgi:hypothetical protein